MAEESRVASDTGSPENCRRFNWLQRFTGKRELIAGAPLQPSRQQTDAARPPRKKQHATNQQEHAEQRQAAYPDVATDTTTTPT